MEESKFEELDEKYTCGDCKWFYHIDDYGCPLDEKSNICRDFWNKHED